MSDMPGSAVAVRPHDGVMLVVTADGPLSNQRGVLWDPGRRETQGQEASVVSLLADAGPWQALTLPEEVNEAIPAPNQDLDRLVGPALHLTDGPAITTRAQAYAVGALAGTEPGSPIQFIVATPGRKRDGLRLSLPFSLSAYNSNPIVLLFHDANRMSIGRARMESRQVAGGYILSAWVEFDMEDPVGAAADRKYRNGYMFAVSLGWHDIDSAGQPVLVTRKPPVAHEPLELSVVNIPSDPEALLAMPASWRRGVRALVEDALPSLDIADSRRDSVWRMTRALRECEGDECVPTLDDADPLEHTVRVDALKLAMLQALWTEDPQADDVDRWTAYEALMTEYEQEGLKPPQWLPAREFVDTDPEQVFREGEIALMKLNETELAGTVAKPKARKRSSTKTDRDRIAKGETETGGASTVSVEDPIIGQHRDQQVARQRGYIGTSQTRQIRGFVDKIRGARSGLDAVAGILAGLETEVDTVSRALEGPARRKRSVELVGPPAARETRLSGRSGECMGAGWLMTFLNQRLAEMAPDPSELDGAIESLASAAGVSALAMDRALRGEGPCFTVAQLQGIADVLPGGVAPETLIALAGGDGCTFADDGEGGMRTVEDLLGVAPPPEQEEYDAAEPIEGYSDRQMAEADSPKIDVEHRAPGTRAGCGCRGGSERVAPAPAASIPSRVAGEPVEVERLLGALTQVVERIERAIDAIPAPSIEDPAGKTAVVAEAEDQPPALEDGSVGRLMRTDAADDTHLAPMQFAAALDDAVARSMMDQDATLNALIASVADATGINLGVAGLILLGKKCPPSADWVRSAAGVLGADPAPLLAAASADGCFAAEAADLVPGTASLNHNDVLAAVNAVLTGL